MSILINVLLIILLSGTCTTIVRNADVVEARHGTARNAKFRVLAEMERNLEQRLAQLGRESQDRVITVDPSHGDSTHTTHALSGHSSIAGPYSDAAEEIGEYSSMIQDANIVPVLVVPRLEEGVSDYMDAMVARTEHRPIQFRPVKPEISEKLNKYLGRSPIQAAPLGREKRQDELEPLLPEKSTVCETHFDWVLLNRTWDKDGQEVEIFHGKYAQYVHVYYCANKGGTCRGISEEFTSECLEKEAFAKLLVKKEPGPDGINYQLAVVQIPHHCFCQLTKRLDV
ncbi:uncharacterized protein LOC111268936 isoform X1 [Varroa jacobsoni]|uniref:Spaetzle domain-containing protein n=2 Tax=Varroa destructor TaxID=109461 RepID=A0A7M7M6J6_VARDE|nr:uncharacterized protein LOC111246997 isoform X1 [Varroa destructor]XP_022703919.1 uncharacterized protein LOC111268936 isoform X1 [Varroa jacobsoni]